MQYEISGSVLAGQITTTTWAWAPSRTWAWSRAIGGAGRGIGGAGQFASWTRAAQLRTSTRAEAAVARATVPPRRSTLRWTCPGRALGEGSGRSGLGAPWTRAAQFATSAWAVAPSRTWAWSRAIGGVGRGIGGAGQLASWTRAAQLAALARAEAAVARATVPPQAFNSAVDLPRARLGRSQRSIGPGRAVDQGGSARDVGLGGGSVEDLGMNASTLERIRFAAANRLCVDVGYARGTCKGWSHTHCARLAAAMLCYMPARPAPPNVLPIELAAFRRLRSQGRRSFRSTPTSTYRIHNSPIQGDLCGVRSPYGRILRRRY